MRARNRRIGATLIVPFLLQSGDFDSVTAISARMLSGRRDTDGFVFDTPGIGVDFAISESVDPVGWIGTLTEEQTADLPVGYYGIDVKFTINGNIQKSLESMVIYMTKAAL